MCVKVSERCSSYLLPGESHPLKALLSVLSAVTADKFKEVVSFQVAGLLTAELSLRTQAETHLRLTVVTFLEGKTPDGAAEL